MGRSRSGLARRLEKTMGKFAGSVAWLTLAFCCLPVCCLAGGAFETECDHDFEECGNGLQIREVFSISPSEGSTTGGTRITLTGAGFSTDFLNGGNTVVFGSGAAGAKCTVLQGSCTAECTTSSTLICDTLPHSTTGKKRVHVGIDSAFSAKVHSVRSALLKFWPHARDPHFLFLTISDALGTGRLFLRVQGTPRRLPADGQPRGWPPRLPPDIPWHWLG